MPDNKHIHAQDKQLIRTEVGRVHFCFIFKTKVCETKVKVNYFIENIVHRNGRVKYAKIVFSRKLQLSVTLGGLVI